MTFGDIYWDFPARCHHCSRWKIPMNGCHGGIVMAGDNDHPKKGGWLKIFNRLPTILMLPSGKRLHNYGKSPFSSWVNPLFLWPFSIDTS